MAGTLKQDSTYDPPTGGDRVYEKQYDEGYSAAIYGQPYGNPYQTLDTPFSRVQDLRSYWWQSGYRDYEGA